MCDPSYGARRTDSLQSIGQASGGCVRQAPNSPFGAYPHPVRAFPVQRYAVAFPDRQQALAALTRMLEAGSHMRLAVRGPIPDPTYYRLGLSPGMALRVSELRETSDPRSSGLGLKEAPRHFHQVLRRRQFGRAQTD